MAMTVHWYEGRTTVITIYSDGQSNVLKLQDRHFEKDATYSSLTECLNRIRNLADNCKRDGELNSRNTYVPNATAQSTDFACTYSGCTYHHASEIRIVMHARSHINFEASPDAFVESEMRYSNGRYTCSKCPRSTTDRICFREHIRHHLFSRPYKCAACSIPVASIPDLRLHYQKFHSGMQAEFQFSEDGRFLDNITMILRQDAEPVLTPIRFSYLENAANSQEFSGSQKSTCHADRHTGSENNCAVSSTLSNSWAQNVMTSSRQGQISRMPGKYACQEGLYSCATCKFKTTNKEAFRQHAWKHIHNTWASGCRHNSSKILSLDCSVVNGLMEVLGGISLKDLTSDSVPTENHLHHPLEASKLAINVDRLTQNHERNANDRPENGFRSVSNSDEISVNHSPTSSNASNCDDIGSRTSTETGRVGALSSTKLVQLKKQRDGSAHQEMTVIHDRIPLKEKCDKCSFTCNNAAQMSIHQKTGHGFPAKADKFHCSECLMTTPKKDVLIWHLSHHLGEHTVKYFMCSNCDIDSQREHDIELHIQKKHGKATRRITAVPMIESVSYLQNIMKCPVCSGGFIWKNIFVNHIRSAHQLTQLARFLDCNYKDAFPDSIRFPVSLIEGRLDKDGTAIHKRGSVSTAEAFNDVSEMPVVSRYHCENCDFSTNLYDDFVVHRSFHETANGSVCGTVLPTTPSVPDSHSTSLDVLARKSSFKCDKCAFESASNDAYSRHVTDHKLYDDICVGFQCRYCAYQHSRLDCVVSHMKSFHSNHRNLTPVSIDKKPQPTKQVAKKKTAKDRPLLYKAIENRSKNYRSPYSTTSASTPVAVEKVPTLPKSLSDAALEEFEKTLPDAFVFAEDVKCPKCFFSSRVRVNLIRHFKTHKDANKEFAGNSKSASSSRSPGKKQLSYHLWQPKSPTGKNVENGTTATHEVARKSVTKSSCSHSSRNGDVARPTADVNDETSSNDGTSTNGNVSCEECGAKFTGEGELERHISQYHAGPYVCHLCGLLLWQKSGVQKHYGSHHPTDTMLFELFNKKKSSYDAGTDGFSKVVIAQGKDTSETPAAQSSETTCLSKTIDDAATSGGGDAAAMPQIQPTFASPAAVGPPSNVSADTLPPMSVPQLDMLMTSLSMAGAVPSMSVPTMPLAAAAAAGCCATQTPFAWPMGFGSANLMTALGNMESIAILAAKLVPILANMDVGVLMSMMQIANPALAAALGNATGGLSAANGINQQLAALFTQLASSSYLPNAFPAPAANIPGSDPSFTSQSGTPSSAPPPDQSPSASATDHSVGPSSSSAATSSVTTGSLIDKPSRCSSALSDPTSDGESVTQSESSSSSSLPAARPRHRPVDTSSVSSESTFADRPSRRRKRRRIQLDDDVDDAGGTVYFRCPKCSYLTEDVKAFARHSYLEMREERRWLEAIGCGRPVERQRQRCGYCTFSSYLPEEFQEHATTHNVIKRYNCVYCSFNAFTLDALKKHLARSHPGRQFARHVEPRSKVKYSHSKLTASIPRRALDLNPTVRLVDVLKLSRAQIRDLRCKFNVETIDLSGF